MIFTMVFYVLSYLVTMICDVLPAWTIWPDSLLNSITYFSNSILSLNFLLPISELFTILMFLINFEVFYLSTKIVAKLFNYVRGTGSGIDL
jgi:hypothetical protein